MSALQSGRALPQSSSSACEEVHPQVGGRQLRLTRESPEGRVELPTERHCSRSGRSSAPRQAFQIFSNRQPQQRRPSSEPAHHLALCARRRTSEQVVNEDGWPDLRLLQLPDLQRVHSADLHPICSP